MAEEVQNRSQRNGLQNMLDVVICPVYAIAVSCLLVLLLAIVVHFAAVSPSVIGPVNQIIKAASILAGTWLGLRRAPQKGWLKGMLTGMIFMSLGLMAYGSASGEQPGALLWLTDLALGALVGAISGILGVNILGRSGKKTHR